VLVPAGMARSEPATRPGLAWTYDGGRPALLERALPLIDFIEVMPDAVSQMEGNRAVLDEVKVAELEAIAPRAAIIIHGIGLSIGSAEGWSARYLGLLDELVPRLHPRWHSEHLGYVSVGGDYLGTMLTMPRTEEALDLLVERVQAIQGRFGIPFLLENIVRILPDYPAEYSEAAFLNELTTRTGCGLLLDVYNLQCDVRNNGFDLDSFLEELDIGQVQEIHVAGGVEHRGFQLDIHSTRVAPSTVALAERVIAAAGSVRAVTFELLDEAVESVGEDGIVAELALLRERLVEGATAL